MGIGNDYVKYFTQTLVKYIDQPKDERKKLRMERRDTRETFVYRWFGIMPFLVMQSRKRKRKNRE